MDIHKNARLTPKSRKQIVRQVLSGQTPKAAAFAVCVCPRAVRKWLTRYRIEGLAGLEEAQLAAASATGAYARWRSLRRSSDCAASA